MITGDVITIRYGGLPTEATIIDDCYRVDGQVCTALIRLNHAPYTELEINLQEINRGKDIQGPARLGS
jgi:hypothetical protein